MISSTRIGSFCGIVGFLGCSLSAYGQIRAFGSAEGFGAAAVGARVSPSVYHVTNLNASGAGSFVDAIGTANRIIVFDVGGVINLTSAPSAKSNLYIAGQSAPGGGITINGYQALGLANTSNNIVRHLRIRPGDSSPSTDNCIGMGQTTTAILDHLSLEFAKWNNIDAVSVTADRPLVTIQNCLIADPIGQQFGAHLEAVNGFFTITKNVFANSHNRNPLAKVNDQSINNIGYNNEAGYTTHTSTPFDHDVINNAFIWGPTGNGNSDYYQLSAGDTYYATGNVQDSNVDGVLNGSASNPTTGTIVGTPNFASTLSLPILSVADAYANAVSTVGASLVRDQLDTLVMSQVQTLGNGVASKTGGAGPSGGLYGSAASTGLPNGGLGTIATATRPVGFDADNDGVADAWETTHGMNPALASDNILFNPLGYRMIEQYLNELGDTNITRTYSATIGSLTTVASWGGTLPNGIANTKVTGTGAANGLATVTSGIFSVMKMDIGGNGPAAGEVVNISGGTLDVYDQITVGFNNNATLNISGTGTVEGWNIQLGNTVFSPAATNYTGNINLSGGTLAVSSLVRGAGTPSNWTSGGAVTITGGTIKALGTLYINVPLAFNGTSTINTNGFDGSINGNMTGTAALTKSGAGTLSLVGNNSGYTGPIALNTGAITLNMNGANSPTGLITLANGTQINVQTSGASTPITPASGATVTLNGIGGLTYGGIITGPSNSTILITGTSTGTSNFSLGNTISGFSGTLDFTNGKNVRINTSGSAAAKFVMGDNSALIRVPFGATVNMGSLTGGATSIIQGATNDAVTTIYSIGALNTSTTYSGTIVNGIFSTPGSTALTKVGSGTLTLGSAANTYTGVTTISGGTLAVGTLANGGNASSIGQSSNAAANLILDGGTLLYTGGSSTIDRTLTVTQAGGTIDASGSNALVFNSIADVAQTGTGNRTFTLTGTNTAFNGFTPKIIDPTSGITSFVKSGVGTWRLFNANTYSGSTNVTGGSLLLVAGGALPSTSDLSVSSGALVNMYGNHVTINGLNGSGTVTTTQNTARTLTVGNGNASGNFTGTLTQGATQTLSFSKTGTGTQILNGTYDYTGSTTVSGGVLRTVKPLQNNTALTINTNALLDVPFNGAASGVSRIKSLSIPVAGAGFAGKIDLHNNDLVVDYTGAGNSYSSILNMVQSGLTLLGGNGTGIGSSEVDAQTIGGTILAVVDNGDPNLAGGITTLSGYTIPNPSSSVLVKYTWFGDSNLDGIVTGADYALADTGFTSGGALTGWVFGDYDFDGLVTAGDYALLDTGFISQTGALPEPATLGALSLGAIALLRRKRARNRLN